MTLLKHPKARDIAIRILEKRGKLWWREYFVEWYNINYTAISGNPPAWIYSEWTKIKDLNQYKEWTYEGRDQGRD